MFMTTCGTFCYYMYVLNLLTLGATLSINICVIYTPRLGAVLVIEGSMTVGNLTTFIFYTIYIAIYLGILSGLYTDFMNAVGASERIFQILDTKPRINTHGGVFPGQGQGDEAMFTTTTTTATTTTIATTPTTAGHIVFDDVSFRYPSRPDIPVLSSFSLEVSPRQTVAIVGASGSGKSTVFALLERYYEAADDRDGDGEGEESQAGTGGVCGGGGGGRILLDGIDIRDLDPRYLHSAVSIVPQEPTLFSGTIFSNIIYSSLAQDPLGINVSPSLDDVMAVAKQANAHEFIMQFPEQYDTLVGERGVRLSGIYICMYVSLQHWFDYCMSSQVISCYIISRHVVSCLVVSCMYGAISLII